MEMLKVGDRVMKSGFAWRGDTLRFGEVVECYNGKPTAVASGVPMIAIRWDDTPDRIDYGYLQGGNVKLAPLVLPMMATSQIVIE